MSCWLPSTAVSPRPAKQSTDRLLVNGAQISRSPSCLSFLRRGLDALGARLYAQDRRAWRRPSLDLARQSRSGPRWPSSTGHSRGPLAGPDLKPPITFGELNIEHKALFDWGRTHGQG